MMADICFCFHIHQPLRLKWFGIHNSIPRFDDINDYFDNAKNKHIINRASRKCYLPANDLLLKMIDYLKPRFKIAFSVSGVFLEQLEKFRPDVLETFKKLSETGCVEFLSETYYHSLASIYEDKTEFIEQVKEHKQALRDYLNYKKPSVFRNTELIYNNKIGETVEKLGFKGVFTEGTERILGWRSPNYVYKPPYPVGNISLLLRNYKLSDDIGYRFGARWWKEWPLTAEKYASWLSACPGQVLNIYIDYETFGEHHWPESGIFWFLGRLPHEILRYKNLSFKTPSEIVEKHKPVGELDVFEYNTISWADAERDVSAWIGNKMQKFAFNQVKSMDPKSKKLWRYLQISDHFYYMCTKGWGDGDVHCYFSPYSTAQDGFLNYMKALNSIRKL